MKHDGGNSHRLEPKNCFLRHVNCSFCSYSTIAFELPKNTSAYITLAL